jgi:hypothetical protein
MARYCNIKIRYIQLERPLDPANFTPLVEPATFIRRYTIRGPVT